MADRSLLVVMSKDPVPGKVKTRLQPRLSAEDAAELYRCFLLDRLDEMSALGGIDTAVAFAPPSAAEAFSSLVPSSFSLFPQQGNSLSERLAAVVAKAFKDGFSRVSIIDSDSPDLPRERVLDSFRLLRGEADAVFGPCRDGGYYLVGLRVDRGDVFDGIPWSTPGVLTRSVARAAQLGLAVSLLEPWQDIDTFEDLLDFMRRREGGLAAGAEAARTMRFLRGKKIFP